MNNTWQVKLKNVKSKKKRFFATPMELYHFISMNPKIFKNRFLLIYWNNEYLLRIHESEVQDRILLNKTTEQEERFLIQKGAKQLEQQKRGWNNSQTKEQKKVFHEKRAEEKRLERKIYQLQQLFTKREWQILAFLMKQGQVMLELMGPDQQIFQGEEEILALRQKVKDYLTLMEEEG